MYPRQYSHLFGTYFKTQAPRRISLASIRREIATQGQLNPRQRLLALETEHTVRCPEIGILAKTRKRAVLAAPRDENPQRFTFPALIIGRRYENGAHHGEGRLHSPSGRWLPAMANCCRAWTRPISGCCRKRSNQPKILFR